MHIHRTQVLINLNTVSIRAYDAKESFRHQVQDRIDRYLRAALSFYNLNRFVLSRALWARANVRGTQLDRHTFGHPRTNIHGEPGILPRLRRHHRKCIQRWLRHQHGLYVYHTFRASSMTYQHLAASFTEMIIWWVRYYNDFEGENDILAVSRRTYQHSVQSRGIVWSASNNISILIKSPSLRTLESRPHIGPPAASSASMASQLVTPLYARSSDRPRETETYRRSGWPKGAPGYLLPCQGW